jgi:hypothetical protein
MTVYGGGWKVKLGELRVCKLMRLDMRGGGEVLVGLLINFEVWHSGDPQRRGSRDQCSSLESECNQNAVIAYANNTSYPSRYCIYCTSIQAHHVFIPDPSTKPSIGGLQAPKTSHQTTPPTKRRHHAPQIKS